MRNRGDILPMILPGATRSWAGTWRELVNAAPVRIHNRAYRGVRTKISRAENPITVGIDLAGE